MIPNTNKKDQNKPLQYPTPFLEEETLWQKSLRILHFFPSIDGDAWDAAIVSCGRASRWQSCLHLLKERWRVTEVTSKWRPGKGQGG